MLLENIKCTVGCLVIINSDYCLRKEMKNADTSLKNTFLSCYFTEIRFSPEDPIMLNNNRPSRHLQK